MTAEPYCDFGDSRDLSRSRWTILHATTPGRSMARCACGTVREVRRANIASGASLSCGCMTERLGRPPVDPHARFWAQVDKRGETECWTWVGHRNSRGYGLFKLAGRTHRAHRWSYEATVGPIPSGLTLDHLCRNTSCVNTAHLEPVTNAENARRASGWTYASDSTPLICGRGHDLTRPRAIHADARGSRRCRECTRERLLAS